MDGEEAYMGPPTIRHVSTLSMEAAGRKGCRFCGFILSDDCQNFDICRKIERRLELLKKDSQASICIGDATAATQSIWLDFPGHSRDVTSQLSRYPWAHKSQAITPSGNLAPELWLEALLLIVRCRLLR
jgi:hypothetical protein